MKEGIKERKNRQIGNPQKAKKARNKARFEDRKGKKDKKKKKERKKE